MVNKCGLNITNSVLRWPIDHANGRYNGLIVGFTHQLVTSEKNMWVKYQTLSEK